VDPCSSKCAGTNDPPHEGQGVDSASTPVERSREVARGADHLSGSLPPEKFYRGAQVGEFANETFDASDRAFAVCQCQVTSLEGVTLDRVGLGQAIDEITRSGVQLQHALGSLAKGGPRWLLRLPLWYDVTGMPS
jgi:hypothetical protein